MKKITITIAMMMAMVLSLFAQVPQTMSYQAVVRNAENTIVALQPVSIELSILQGSDEGAVVYTETHNTMTNANGLVTLEIGAGESGDNLSAIDWSAGPYFVKTVADVEGKQIIGISPIMVVPYAKYAETAGNVPDMSEYAKKSDIPTEANLNDYATKDEIPSLTEYAKKSDLPDLSKYATKEDIPDVDLSNYAKLSDIPTEVDLSEYAKKSDIPAEVDMSVYVKKSELPTEANLSEYAKKSDIPAEVDLIGYAKKSDIPAEVDMTAYVKKSEIPTEANLSEYAKKSDIPAEVDLSGYAKKSDIPAAVDMSAYAKKSDLPTEAELSAYAKLEDIPAAVDMSEYVKSSEVPTETNLTEYAKKSDLPTEAELSAYAKLEDIPAAVDMSEYVKSSEVPTETNLTEYAKKSDLPTEAELSAYAKAADIPSLDGYAKAADIPSLDGYAKTTDIPSLDGYAKAADIPSLDGYAKTTDVPSLDGYAKTTDVPSLDGYAKTTDIPSLDGYAKTTDIPSLDGYAKTTDIPSLDGYAKTTDIPSLDGYAKAEDIPSLDGYAKAADIPSLDGYAKAADIPSLDGYAKTTDIPSLNGYVQKTELNKYVKKEDIPAEVDLSDYVKKADVDLNNFYSKSELDAMIAAMESMIIGEIQGVFSVSAEKQVKFSKGNLRYRLSTNTWKFADNQYDIVGEGNNNTTENYEGFEGWVDLFSWGTSGWNSGAVVYKPCITNFIATDFFVGGSDINDLTGDYANADWGVYNRISNGGNTAGMWRTLTSAEWEYLINQRANAKKLRAPATVNDVTGLILLPDNWKSIEGITFINTETVIDEKGYATNVYSTDEWEKMEANGAVFLPAAGVYSGQVVSVGEVGDYWSSSVSEMERVFANLLCIHPFYIWVDDARRDSGRSVRLVKDVD